MVLFHRILVAILAGTTLAFGGQVSAHPGRTDASGCHHNRATGSYHCHPGGTGGSFPALGSRSPSIPIHDPINTIDLPGAASFGDQSPGWLTTQVVSVGDGNTFRVTSEGKPLTVRLACVDAPEMAQVPDGPAAAQRLKQLLPIGQVVSLRVVDTDRYHRTVAEVYRNGTAINLQLVQEGQAVVYRQYLSGCPTLRNQLLQAEAQAKQQRLGFWKQANPILPSDFRRQKRSSRPEVPELASSHRTLK